MSNTRIVSDNAADRATPAASSEAAGFAAANLLTDKKSEVWRATAASATLTLTWNAGETVACVILPFCNFSPTATIRVRGYSDAAGTNLLFDTGAAQACPAPAASLRGWTTAQAASAYAYGGGVCARVWFAQATVQHLVIDLADAANLQGYLEAARLVCGPYWSPQYNPSATSDTWVDLSAHYRTGAGDLMTDAGPVFKSVPIQLDLMPADDRAKLAGILRNSRAYPIFLSVFPESSDLELERDHSVYGKRDADSEVATQYAVRYGTTIKVVSI